MRTLPGLSRLPLRLAAALTFAGAGLAASALAPRPLAAQSVDVIRGRITAPDSTPIEGAQITVTSISGNVNRTARTDRNGRFTVTFPNGDGDYMVGIAAIGYAPRRFEVKRALDEEILVADARLQRVGTVLDAVRVNAARERVTRNDAAQPDVGGSEQQVGNAPLPAADLGDLAAMAATLPGVQLVPGQDGDPNGFSVLGLGSDQNQTTLNGMNFGGANLPRDAGVSSSLATSPYDVSRGGFSGAQFTLRTRSGSNFLNRGLSLNVDAPQLQWTDRAAQALGQQYSNVSLGGAVSGPIVFDKAFYNVSYQLGRRANDYQSLLNTDPLGLQTAGVAADSVNRLRGLLGTQGVPLAVGHTPSSRHSDNGSLFGSIDVAPPSSTGGHAYNLTFNASWNRTDPAAGAATDFPSLGGTREGWRGGLQGRHTGYFTLKGVGILSETSVGFAASANDGTPDLTLPAGRVRVNSELADGTSGVQTLGFGGNQNLDSRQSTTQTQASSSLSWFSANNRHRLRLTSEARLETASQENRTNLLGTFAYQSLADLEANRPASYSRILAPRERSTGQVIAGASLGDAWRPRRDVQVQYGVRLDASRFLDTPEANPAVMDAFGVRNDRAPASVFLSPRAGFSWTYGQAAQIGAFEGAFRGPRAAVRGGVGLFRNTPGTNQLGQALDNTGLPNAARQLACVGAATPIPDWDAYAAGADVPTQCADGSAFGNGAPAVALFAKDWAPQRSVRSNLQWSGPILDNRFSLTADVTYSMNLGQPSTVDLNFDPTTRFTLADEGRPVYADAARIVPATGAVAPAASRRDTAFARVSELRSDLRSESRQLQLRLNPVSFNSNFSWNVSYTLASVREQTRGFGGSFTSNTAGDPLAVEWARSPFDARHQFTYTFNYNAWDFLRLGWFGQLRSGAPYTPMVAGDVNGDGYSNDRAYVFDRNSTQDAALADAMEDLLANGSGSARECLARQRGRIASRNSCQGPWYSTGTLTIGFNPLKVRLPQRANLQFQVSNPLGAADMLVNGTDDLKGWGQAALPDANLLYVRGFDAATGRFRYEANRRFGATSPQASQFRAPVTLTAMMRLDVGPTRERQLLTQQLDRGRTLPGTRAPEPMLRVMYGGGGIANPMEQILRQQDSLRLTAKQADSIASMNRRYRITLDSIWSPVATYFAALPERYDEDIAYGRYLRARRASVDYLTDLAPHVRGLLTPEQRRKLPALVAAHLEPRYLASIRNGTAGQGGGAPMMMGGGGGPVFMGGGGGGGNVQIIRQ